MPLFGKRILVTRATSQATGLGDLIHELGGEALEIPVIRIEQPGSAELADLDRALHQVEHYKWLFFTSVNGVEYFFKRMHELRIDIRKLNTCRIAAIGPKTAETLEAKGLYPVALPSKYDQATLFASLQTELKQGDAVLLPRADIAADTLPNLLKQNGAIVTEVSVYQTVPATEHATELVQLLQERELQIITFTSSSTVNYLWDLIEQQGENPASLLADVEVACIGPITAKTIEARGLSVHYQAEEATIESLVASIVKGVK
jgi:uroporphyrinogen III methyltransferase/synthase